MLKTKRIVTGLVIITIMSLTIGVTAFAGTWKTGIGDNQSRWWYDNDNGSYAANGWYWIDGNKDGIAECYYFDKDGWMYASAETPDGYTVNENGAWVTNGTVEVTSSLNGDYRLVKHVYADGTTITGDGLYQIYVVTTLRLINVTEDSLTVIYDYKEGEDNTQSTYVFKRNGEFYQNDGETESDGVAYMQFNTDGTLVVFDDIYGDSYYQK